VARRSGIKHAGMAQLQSTSPFDTAEAASRGDGSPLGASPSEPFRTSIFSAQQCPRGQSELILLVDDDSTVRFIAAKILTTFGYRVLTAENGAEGIATYLLRRAEIALVISDLLMPVMDGPTMIRRLIAVNPEARIIVVSGSIGCSDKVKLPEHGVLHYLEKPYTTPALLQCVHAALSEAPHPVDHA
jgi:CheY-like chemotaxis protein